MAEPAAAVNRGLLWAEFLALYFGAPLVIALFMPGRLLFQALAVFSIAGLLLLWRTGGFHWRGLVHGWGSLPWGGIGLVALVTLIVSVAILWVTSPESIFRLIWLRPHVLLMIWCLYPLVSALPQELIFRPLFFHRYGALLPSGQAAIILNAAVFSFAHLMYWSWVVAILTFLGGWVFAYTYVRRGFPAAWVLHAVAGNVLFAVGMGVYFYSGNVVRPF
ncbi:CPBP family glutamic-type intramembrane protease [uncultured Paracoccus sp.]|uniref:CPBP family glutamic-type intramembrane protease n=1 Tax=uncultured Paracoccus sp. TaxID=189685 RepID=UPI002594B752|nr:CPBP family glutamic-type intramembrane protease [uncultured Paracoccus sp.]